MLFRSYTEAALNLAVTYNDLGKYELAREVHEKATRGRKTEEGPDRFALGKIANQLYEGDARTRASLTETRQDLTAILRRVDRLEARTPEAEIVDGVVARVAERLEQAEANTQTAVRALETSFAQLDQRLAFAESRLSAEPEDRKSTRLNSSH